jgi:hypothetical protein
MHHGTPGGQALEAPPAGGSGGGRAERMEPDRTHGEIGEVVAVGGGAAK